MTKYCRTEDLKPDMVIAADVRSRSGQVIVKEGTVLTDRLIFRLKFYSIEQALVTIPAPTDKAAEPADARPSAEPAQPIEKPDMQAPSYSQKVVRSKEFMDFQIMYSRVIGAYRNVFDGFVFRQETPDYELLLSLTKDLYARCKTSLELFDMLHNMRSLEDSVYAHCLNVALISRRLGRWLKFSREDLDTVTLCGILHDIGKLSIPDEILNKPGKYTDEEFALVRTHPQAGYRLLSSLPLNPQVKMAALCHHERCDGSGYPNGIKQNGINTFTGIVAIADVYDAMTAARSYRAPLCVFEVIANFEKDGLSKYHPQLILTFLSHIANTYQSNRVMLNDGRTANIVMLNEKRLSRPIVQFTDGSCLDLTTEPDLFIKTVL